jgi:pyrroloquinoline quinone biosynthesis protein E
MNAPRPYTLIAELTYRCPLRCLYCSNPIAFAREYAELSTDEWCRTFAEAAALGVVQVHLSGGEPALRDDLLALVAQARSCELYTNLITGGARLDEARLRGLRDAGLDHVQLSIQDTDPETAALVAGARVDARKRAVAALVRAVGLPLTLNVVIHRLNIDRIPQLIALATDLGAQRVELASTQFYAWALENRQALMPTRAQYLRAEAVVADAMRCGGGIEIAFVRSDYVSREPKPCMGGWGRSYMCITPRGEVLPCHAAAVIPGLRFTNVREQPLAEIWNDSPALNAFRGDGWMHEPCRSCARKAIDFGGCRCQAFLLVGDAAATDPICELSPHRGVVAAAADPTAGSAPLRYRDAATSRLLTPTLTDT